MPNDGNSGQRIIITGAANGIGLATARLLADDGAHLCLFDLDDEALNRVSEELGGAAQGKILTVAGSVCDPDRVDQCVELARSELGGIDGLVNSAGLAGAAVSTELAVADWQRMVDVNLTGSFLFARCVARQMLAQGTGSIVNLASIYGRSGAPGRAAYCATKAAIVGLTHSLAVEWAPSGVRVNAVAPAYTNTKMVADMVQSGHVQIDNVLNRTPMHRLIEPQEVAAMIAFLLSDRSSATTGEVIGVDGGWNAFGFY